MLRTLSAVMLIALLALLVPFPASAQDGDRPVTHVVQAGENLFRIALRYNITVEALMAANGLTDSSLVVTGQSLTIPQGGAVMVSAHVVLPERATHTVVQGETLLSIARQYGVTPEALMQANDLRDPSVIYSGQVLGIPVANGQADLGLIGVQMDFSPIQLDLPPADLGIFPANGTHAPAAAAIPAAVSLAQTDTTQPDNEVDSAPEADSAPAMEVPASSPEAAPASAEPEAAPARPVSGAPDPALTTPDLGILSPGETVPETVPSERSNPEPAGSAPTDPGLASQDLGILAPEAAAWALAPGILTVGDSASVRAIFEHGLELGNNPHAFSKIGDCNSESPFFLAKFDKGEYDLGPYGYLQPTITYFAGSFSRQSAAVWTGNHAWAVFDPTWANPAICQPGEAPIDCEFRVNRPSVVLVRLGTNEANAADLFEQNLRRIVEFSIDHGVIPVLGTKADHLEGSDAINDITRTIAAEYGVPLWDFGRVADTIPGRGLIADGFHMTWYPLTYGDPQALQAGHSVQNLLALMELHTVLHAVLY